MMKKETEMSAEKAVKQPKPKLMSIIREQISTDRDFSRCSPISKWDISMP